MIHIVNGDVVGNKLKQIEGDIIIWREMYDFGPLSLTWSKDEQIETRASFFEERLGIPSQFFIENCQTQERLLTEIPMSEEIILWFEHDRFDQTMLMYLLSQLSSHGYENLSMISINQFPGISPFYGLGQLSSEQLMDLIAVKKKLTTEQIHEAITGWRAYISNDIADIQKWIEDENHSLPFLLQILKNHNNFFPSRNTGLNEIEHLALSLISRGECLFYDLFSSVIQTRVDDGLSNLHFAAILKELMKEPYPLMQSDQPLPNYLKLASNARLEITSYGLDVLTGRRNRFDLVGIDWWVGGVHLRNSGSEKSM